MYFVLLKTTLIADKNVIHNEAFYVFIYLFIYLFICIDDKNNRQPAYF